jgi:NADPH-dependent curcumin reductase CurA
MHLRENVGGDFLEGAIENLKTFGRVVVCGLIAQYNDENNQGYQPYGYKSIPLVLTKRIKMQG